MSAVDNFMRAYAPDPDARRAAAWSDADTKALLGTEPRDFTEFVAKAARNSFEGGILRCVLPDTPPGLVAWNGPDGWRSDWPDLPRFVAWASDWYGRLWCFDLDQRVRGEPAIVRFEPGTAAWSETDLRFTDVIGRELPDYREDWLSESFYRDWLASGGAAPRPDQCVSYKVPPFLGGEEDLPNLEISDLAVHLSVLGQLTAQTADVEPGTSIDSVELR